MKKNDKTQNDKTQNDKTQNISKTNYDFSRLEFHRHAVALLPEKGGTGQGVAILDRGPKFDQETRYCSCKASRKSTCSHILEMMEMWGAFYKQSGDAPFATAFAKSIWSRLAVVISENRRDDLDSLVFKQDEDGKTDIFNKEGEQLLSWFSNQPDFMRFSSRCGQVSGKNGLPQRSKVLQKLKFMTLTETEITLNYKGLKSRRQIFETGFWHCWGYHCFREFNEDNIIFHPRIADSSGDIILDVCLEQETVFRLFVPRNKVASVIKRIGNFVPEDWKKAIEPVKLESSIFVTLDTEQSLVFEPVVSLESDGGNAAAMENDKTSGYDLDALSPYTYGRLVYLRDRHQFGELPPPRFGQKAPAQPFETAALNDVPNFLSQNKDILLSKPYVLDQKLADLKIHESFDTLEIKPDILERDWCWLSMSYGIGNTRVSLSELLKNRKAKKRYIKTDDGWIDCDSPGIKDLADLVTENDAGKFGISRLDLFKIRALMSEKVEVCGEDENAASLNRFFELQPAQPLPTLKGLKSALRAYQKRGAEWLHFLYENNFGGLLCDDMGLGKTHQVMAFMLWLTAVEKVKEPFLVVCPTTVLSHWEQKIEIHAPKLKTAIYYGSERSLTDALKNCHVILTTYGILQRDIEFLKDTEFSVSVFDEMQYLKNPKIKTYAAAKKITAQMKIGLTGTPIENNLYELKALMDVTNPGYLGTDLTFARQYGQPAIENLTGAARTELSHVISPFTLRRMKKTVLSELPDKIEDTLTCQLSEDQVKLYRDAVENRGKNILKTLKDGEEPVPYIHIFALLNLLKQICDHPALVIGEDGGQNKESAKKSGKKKNRRKVNDFRLYASGKWDLFTELMEQCMDSGQKIVVYSQYVRMIDIITDYLTEKGIDFVALTGASRNRKQIINRFNEDPACRVFVGSLKAGGAGIDLIAASVVIHYDRWWNAAKEDQATDRVHRIGQTHKVQVFKLVTKGTLEEKIAAVIDRKRDLMESIVKEDDPGLLKTFSREQLMDMLSV